jgi:signal transduction histidine kinase
MGKAIEINATLGDLDLISASIEAEERLFKVYEIFKSNPIYPGLLVTKNGQLYKMLSKARFYEVMSKQYMFDLFYRRPVHSFFDNNHSEAYLTLDIHLSVLNAATIALQRPIINMFDPIIVKCTENSYKLLDYYVLLLAQNQVHLKTAQLLNEANEFKKEVLGVVAHDLRNPLGAILGLVQLIEQNKPDDKDNKELIKYIHDASLQMNYLINDFLVTAINDATDYQLNTAPFELIRLLDQVIFHFREHAESKYQKILFFHSEDEININADAQKLKEIVENLISNAIKYTLANKQIKIFVENQDDKVIIKVSDEGPGLTDSDKENIFGKFTKLSAKPTAGESSTGLGLYIVKKMIDLHKGNIWVESELGRGSTFIVELPTNIKEKAKQTGFVSDSHRLIPIADIKVQSSN